MGFEKREPKTFFKIKDGAVVVTINPDQVGLYQDLLEVARTKKEIITKQGVPKLEIHLDMITGYLDRIDMNQTEFGKTWNITFVDDFKLYVWSTYFDASLFQGFVNCIAGLKGKYGRIKLSPYFDSKNNTTKMTVFNDGQKLGWHFSIDELPKVTKLLDADGEEATDSKGNPLYNTKKRMQWLQEEVDKIQQHLKQEFKQETDADTEVDYVDEEAF
jgi:hypothetical protein